MKIKSRAISDNVMLVRIPTLNKTISNEIKAWKMPERKRIEKPILRLFDELKNFEVIR